MSASSCVIPGNCVDTNTHPQKLPVCYVCYFRKKVGPGGGGRSIYIYASVFRVNLPPLGMVPPDPGPRAHRPTIRLFKAGYLPYLPLFPHLVKFIANTMQFNTTCNDYDSISQHSHQSTRTTGPQGGRGAYHDHAQGGGGGGATLEHTNMKD